MSEGSRKALLVVDTDASRTASRIKDVNAATAALEAGGMVLMRRDVALPRLAELILSLRQEVDCVVVAGGDGSLSAGAIALRDTGLPLGILPLGEVNDLARALGIPPDPVLAANVILAGHTRRINLGSVNGRPFFTGASVGMSIKVARQLSRLAASRLSTVRFGWAAFRSLLQSRRFSAIIRCGAVVHRVRTVQITIGNGRHYTGGMTPPTSPPVDEAMLGVYSLEPPRRWGLVSMSRAFRLPDGDTVAEARLARSPVVEVVTRLPQQIIADGEMVAVTPARFSVLPQAVGVYAPQLAAEPQAQPAMADVPEPS